jgi:hypothetical protein
MGIHVKRLARGDGYSLSETAGDDGPLVHLTLEETGTFPLEFTVWPGRITVSIPRATWEAIRKAGTLPRTVGEGNEC